LETTHLLTVDKKEVVVTPILPSLKTSLKAALLPSGPSIRRLPLGAGRGLHVMIDFEYQSKLYLGLHETELDPYFRRFCRPGYDCFDVGGGLGYNALLMAKLTGGRVISFECDADACDRIRAMFAANAKVARGLDVRRCFVSTQTDLARSRVALDDAALGEGGFVPDVLNIDVEGEEAAVLQGAVRILTTRQPHVIVETHSAEVERECQRLLLGFGYAPKIIDQRRLLRDHRPLDHNRWIVAEGSVVSRWPR
jgi:hypothetical protein